MNRDTAILLFLLAPAAAGQGAATAGDGPARSTCIRETSSSRSHQEPVQAERKPRKKTGFGFTVLGVPDMDDDDVSDVVVGAPAAAGSAGRLYLLSGASGEKIGVIEGKSGIGWRMCHAGDLDGDGSEEIAVAGRTGSLALVSLKTRAVWREVGGERAPLLPGHTFCMIDRSKDAPARLAISWPYDGSAIPRAGSVSAVSLESGELEWGNDGSIPPGSAAVVWSLDGSRQGECLGSTLTSVEDLDGDGTRDILVAAIPGRGSEDLRGRVLALSGRTGAVLCELTQPDGCQGFGGCLGVLSADAFFPFPRIIVGAPCDPDTPDPRASKVLIYSFETGELLRTLSREGGDSRCSAFGSSLAVDGDLDGDGCADIVIGAPRDDSAGPLAGAVFAYSGRTGELLWRHLGDAFMDHGATLASIQDLNRDGIQDVLATSCNNYESWSHDNEVFALSGRDGMVLWKAEEQKVVDEQ